MGKKVKCIDNLKTTTLTVGKVYDVYKEDDDDPNLPVMYLIDDDNNVSRYFDARRFEVVENAFRVSDNVIKRYAIPVIDKEDPEELRLRSVLLGVRYGECPCKIPRHQCKYHR